MSEPHDPLEELHRQMFQRGQQAEAFEAQQGITKKAAKLAAETLDLATELASSGDPFKEQLASSIRSTVVGAYQEHVANPTAPRARREAPAATPFLGSSPTSETQLPGPSTKALPPASPDPVKKKRGRPPKGGQ